MDDGDATMDNDQDEGMAITNSKSYIISLYKLEDTIHHPVPILHAHPDIRYSQVLAKGYDYMYFDFSPFKKFLQPYSIPFSNLYTRHGFLTG